MNRMLKKIGIAACAMLLTATSSLADYSLEGTWRILFTPSNGSPPFICKVVLEEGSSGWTLSEPVYCSGYYYTTIQSLTLSTANGSDPNIDIVGQITLTVLQSPSSIGIQGVMNQNGNMFVAMSTSTNGSPPFYNMQFVLE